MTWRGHAMRPAFATAHTPAMVEAVLRRRPNSPGAAKLRQILRGEVRVTLSKLEARFLARLRDARLLLPPQTEPPGGGTTRGLPLARSSD